MPKIVNRRVVTRPIKMADTFFKGVLVLVFISVVHCGEWCYTYDDDDFFHDTDTTYCTAGCCGTYNNKYCCFDENISSIVGIVIGCLAGVAFIVATIIAICCCLRKQRGRQGQVIGGAQTTTTTTVTGGAYPMTSYPAPAYGQPAMGYTNAAYPQMQMNTGYPQMPQAGMDQKWQQPPPSYDTVNPS